MTIEQAQSLLNRVRAGDKSIAQYDITHALILTGDICSWVSPLAKETV